MPETTTTPKNVTPLEIIAGLDAAVQLANLLIGWAQGLRERGELTTDQEAELDAKIAALKTLPHWQLSNRQG